MSTFFLLLLLLIYFRGTVLDSSSDEQCSSAQLFCAVTARGEGKRPGVVSSPVHKSPPSLCISLLPRPLHGSGAMAREEREEREREIENVHVRLELDLASKASKTSL